MIDINIRDKEYFSYHFLVCMVPYVGILKEEDAKYALSAGTRLHTDKCYDDTKMWLADALTRISETKNATLCKANLPPSGEVIDVMESVMTIEYSIKINHELSVAHGTIFRRQAQLWFNGGIDDVD